jgi:hypothetical protein
LEEINVIRAIVVTVPFLTSFKLDTVSFLMPVLDLIVCVSVVDDILQVSFIPTLATLLRWSDVVGRVPMQAWAVVMILTPPSISALRSRVLNDSCIQHGLEALDLRVVLLAVLRHQGC